jgi:hypothetical protein
MLLQNSGRFLPDYTVSYAKRPWSITHRVLACSGLMEIFSLYLKIKKKNWIGIVDYAENRKMFKTLHRNVFVMVNVVVTFICILIACRKKLCV